MAALRPIRRSDGRAFSTFTFRRGLHAAILIAGSLALFSLSSQHHQSSMKRMAA
jgi:hypothetical protein